MSRGRGGAAGGWGPDSPPRHLSCTPGVPAAPCSPVGEGQGRGPPARRPQRTVPAPLVRSRPQVPVIGAKSRGHRGPGGSGPPETTALGCAPPEPGRPRGWLSQPTHGHTHPARHLHLVVWSHVEKQLGPLDLKCKGGGRGSKDDLLALGHVDVQQGPTGLCVLLDFEDGLVHRADWEVGGGQSAPPSPHPPPSPTATAPVYPGLGPRPGAAAAAAGPKRPKPPSRAAGRS